MSHDTAICADATSKVLVHHAMEAAVTTHPILTLRNRAIDRAAVLSTRVKVMSAVVAIVAHDLASRRHADILNERRGRNLASADALDRAAVQLSTARVALDEARANVAAAAMPERIQALEADVNRLGLELDEAFANRTREVEEMNERVVKLSEQKIETANGVLDALRAIGRRFAELGDLVHATGVPEVLELLAVQSIPQRHARALVLLEVMAAEARRANEQLGRIHATPAYDLALEEVLDAEAAHSRARAAIAEAARRGEDALSALMAANRHLDAVSAIAGEIHEASGGASHAAESGPGSPEEAIRRGVGESPTAPRTDETQGPGSGPEGRQAEAPDGAGTPHSTDGGSVAAPGSEPAPGAPVTLTFTSIEAVPLGPQPALIGEGGNGAVRLRPVGSATEGGAL